MLGRTVGELRATISNAEYVSWMGFLSWEKWRAERENKR